MIFPLAGIHAGEVDEKEQSACRFLPEYLLWGNAQLQAKRSRGVSPPPLWLPRCDNSRTGAPSSSLSAGAAWGERHCPLLHSYQHPGFHIKGKGILQSRIMMI